MQQQRSAEEYIQELDALSSSRLVRVRDLTLLIHALHCLSEVWSVRPYRPEAPDQSIFAIQEAVFGIRPIELVSFSTFVERQLPAAFVNEQPFAKQVKPRNLFGIIRFCGYDCSILAWGMLILSPSALS